MDSRRIRSVENRRVLREEIEQAVAGKAKMRRLVLEALEERLAPLDVWEHAYSLKSISFRGWG
jgi:hypothetical protein